MAKSNGRPIAYGLVRDKDGNPKIDDPTKAHPIILLMLTPEERKERGIWHGAFVVDAEGTKRVEFDGKTITAVDPLRAATLLFASTTEQYQITPRPDVVAGAKLTIRSE